MQPDNWMVFPFQTHPFQTLWLFLNYSSLLPGRLIDLNYLKRSSKINSNVTYPSFQYFISPHWDFHRKKITSRTVHLRTLQQQLLATKNDWGLGSPKKTHISSNFFAITWNHWPLGNITALESNFSGVYAYWGYLKFPHLVLPENYILLLDPQFSDSYCLVFFMDTEYHHISAKLMLFPCYTTLFLPLLNCVHSHLPWSHCDSVSTFSAQKAKIMSCTEKQDVGWNYRIITWDFHKHL